MEYEDDKEHGLSEIFYSDFHGLSPGDRGYGKLYSKCLYKEGDRLWREEFDLDGNMTRRD